MGESNTTEEVLIDLNDNDGLSKDHESTKLVETEGKTADLPKDKEQSETKPSPDTTTIDELKIRLDEVLKDKNDLIARVATLEKQLNNNRNELEREVQRRCEMEQRFTEDAKRSSDQIDELIGKSNQDDARIMEFQKRVEYFAEETSSMIESFTTNREILTSQLQQLRYENDFLLGKFLSKSRDLQNESIDLPQTVDELQFHCLKLTEKLILSTLAKERLEETIIQGSRAQQPSTPR